MTTSVTIKNNNQGAPYADWDVEILKPDGERDVLLKPGQAATIYLWHDGKAATVREVPK